jgi:hypothetical protein
MAAARTNEQRGDAVREGRLPQLPGVGPVDLRMIGNPENDIDLNLPALLRHLLAGNADHGKSWAQLMAEGWVVDALEGNHRAVENVFDHSQTKRPAEASAAEAYSPIDDAMASKILEFLCDTGNEATSH